MEFKAGTSNVIVGSSGSSKSTIASLVERFYDPTSGEITWDGSSLSDLDLKYFRSKLISYVPQEPILFDTTIAENVAYGLGEADPTSSRERVIQACKMAQAHDFITQLPLGYNTIVGTKGRHLSGGQRARVALARCVISTAPIILLDEVTSNLDTISDRAVHESLRHISKASNKTIVSVNNSFSSSLKPSAKSSLYPSSCQIMITHRLESIDESQMIFVMEAGEVKAFGTHSELVHSNEASYLKLLGKKNAALEGDLEPGMARATNSSSANDSSSLRKDNESEATTSASNAVKFEKFGATATSEHSSGEASSGWSDLKLLMSFSGESAYLILVGLFGCLVAGMVYPVYA